MTEKFTTTRNKWYGSLEEKEIGRALITRPCSQCQQIQQTLIGVEKAYLWKGIPIFPYGRGYYKSCAGCDALMATKPTPEEKAQLKCRASWWRYLFIPVLVVGFFGLIWRDQYEAKHLEAFLQNPQAGHYILYTIKQEGRTLHSVLYVKEVHNRGQRVVIRAYEIGYRKPGILNVSILHDICLAVHKPTDWTKPVETSLEALTKGPEMQLTEVFRCWGKDKMADK